LKVTELFRRGFSVETVEAVQYVPKGFDAFIRFFGAIDDLSVNSNVVLTAVTENDMDTNVMFCR
jgi:hypothetical protein